MKSGSALPGNPVWILVFVCSALGCGAGPTLDLECDDPAGTAVLTWSDGGIWSYTFGDACGAFNGTADVEASSQCKSAQAQASIEADEAQYLYSELDAVMGGATDALTAPRSLTTVDWAPDIRDHPPALGKIGISFADVWTDAPGALNFEHAIQPGQTVSLQSYGFPNREPGQATIHLVGENVQTVDGASLSFDFSIQVVSSPAGCDGGDCN